MSPNGGFSPGRRHQASVAAGFVTGMVAAHVARGARERVCHLLEQSGVPLAILVDPELRIDVDRYADFYNRLANDFDDEAFGMFATPLRRDSFEFLCRSVLGSSNLAEALDRTSRFLRLVLPELRLEVAQVDSSRACLLVGSTPDSPMTARLKADRIRIFAFEWLLRLVHALACWLAGQSVSLDRVHFPYPRPDHADDYALIYTADSRFDPRSPSLKAIFSSTLLDLPVRRDEAALIAFLHGAPGRIAQLYRRDRETVQRVRDLLRDALPTLPGAASVARSFHLSERTLHRRLAEEGSNFRTVRDSLRRDLALRRLARTNQPLSAIAAELGYSDASTFYRAVVGWTGQSPGEFRRSRRMPRQDSVPER
jgi:AraC-like DNA-binding protein